MGVSAHGQAGGGPVTGAAGASTTARGGQRRGTFVIAVAITCAAIAIVAMSFSMRGSPDVGAARPETASATHDRGRSELDTKVAWVHGLASGLVLPSDVTMRLSAQNPEVAEAVMAAWSDLDRSGDRRVRERTVAWIDGLASGLIRPSDVTTRLAAQDHEMGEAVMAAWTDLNE